jgi:hypothetical protein
MNAVVVASAATAVASTAAALVGWRDGDPSPWIWIALVSGPVGVLVGGAAWLRVGTAATALTRASTIASLLVAAFWIVVLAYIISGLR